MINLIISNVIENTTNIEKLTKSINKINKKTCFEFMLISIAIFTIVKAVERHENEIDRLNKRINTIEKKLA